MKDVNTDLEALERHLSDVIDETDERAGRVKRGKVIEENSEMLRWVLLPKEQWDETIECKLTRCLSLDRLQAPTYTQVVTIDHPRQQQASSVPSSQAPPTHTAIIVVLVRLDRVETDILVTINVPQVSLGQNEHDLILDGPEFNQVPEMGEAWKMKDEILRTLEIHDWTLFGDSRS